MSTNVRGLLCEGVMFTHLVGYDGKVCTWWRLSSCTTNLERVCVCTWLGMFLIPVYTYLILGVLVMPITCRL